ncbi:MAG TPA: hypothetical protein VF175_02515, partial [Lacipirellula sp.]
MGVLAVAAMFFVDTEEWLFAAALFVVVEFSVAATIIFYDSLLPHIASPKEMDRVSTIGYALGYLGRRLAARCSPAWFARRSPLNSFRYLLSARRLPACVARIVCPDRLSYGIKPACNRLGRSLLPGRRR